MYLINYVLWQDDLWGSGGITPPILIWALYSGEWSAARPSWGSIFLYPFDTKSGCYGEDTKLPLARNRTSAVKLVVIPIELTQLFLGPQNLYYFTVSSKFKVAPAPSHHDMEAVMDLAQCMFQHATTWHSRRNSKSEMTWLWNCRFIPLLLETRATRLTHVTTSGSPRDGRLNIQGPNINYSVWNCAEGQQFISWVNMPLTKSA
jgi:hypothetical protein